MYWSGIMSVCAGTQGVLVGVYNRAKALAAASRNVWGSDLVFSLLAGAAFFLLLRATPDIPGGDDGYRHVKFAFRLIRGQGVIAQPWKLLCYWPNPVDAWFGYHLLLAPFTLVFDLITAAKALAAAVYGALAFVLLAILKQLDAFCRKGWAALALTGSGMALYRATLTRPFLLSVVLVLAVLYFTLRSSPYSVAFVSGAHALSYSMFFMAAFAPAMYLILRRNKLAAKIVLASCAGLLLGLAASPFFPENARFDVAQAVAPFTAGTAPKLDIPMELQPLSWEWISPSRPVVGLWMAALLIAAWRWKKHQISSDAVLLLAMSCAAFLASLRAGRIFDYFVPLAVLFSAAVISPWILKSRGNRRDALAVATVLLVLCGLNVVAAYKADRKAPPASRFRGVSEYILANSPGTVVFNTQWEQYPFLYFWNSQNTYVAGIDPTLMYSVNARRYWLWSHVAGDEPTTCGVSECSPADSRGIPSTIVEEFGARSVLIEHQRNPRLEQMLRQGPAKEVYRDRACSLFFLADAGQR